MMEMKAKEFADQCILILRDKYLASPTAQTYKIFYEYVLKILSIKGLLQDPIFEVRDMCVIYSKNNRLSALGLDINQTCLNFYKGELSEGLTMQILQMNMLDLREWMESQFGKNWRDDEIIYRRNDMNPDHLFTRPPGYEQCLVSVFDIVPGRWQPRRHFDEQKLEELADSIREFGVLTRLKVFVNENGMHELIAGERRWRASQIAGLAVVPCEIVEWTARQIMEVSIIDNLQRDDLSPEDEGAAFELAIQQLGVSEVELAKRLSKGRTYVQQRRKLASAAPELREALASGQMTFSIIRGILAGAGESHDFQRLGLDAVIKGREAGTIIREKQARQLASMKAIMASTEELEALGWNVSKSAWVSEEQAYCFFVYALNEKPSVWSGGRIYEIIKNKTSPDEIFLQEELVPAEINEDQVQINRLLGVASFKQTCPPYIRVTMNQKTIWMTEIEFKIFNGELKLEIEQRQSDFAQYDIEMRANLNDFSLHTSSGPSKYMALSWDDTGKILLQLQAGEIEIVARYPKELNSVHYPVKPSASATTTTPSRVKCECGNELGKFAEFRDRKGSYKKYCKKCIQSINEEDEAAKAAITNEIAPLLEGATEAQRHILRILIANTSGSLYFENSELVKELARIIWDGAGMRNKDEKRTYIREALKI